MVRCSSNMGLGCRYFVRCYTTGFIYKLDGFLMENNMEIKDTLSTREGQYGKYEIVSQISQDIKKTMRQSPNYYIMPNYARESLDMIANKMARLLNGDYYLNDTWHDIAGYAALVVMTNEDLEVERNDTDAC